MFLDPIQSMTDEPRSKRGVHRGMTLIEVLGGLTILATLLVAMLAARDRYTRQWFRADQRMEAAAVADELLTTWWQKPHEFPRRSAGSVEGWRWQTRIVTDAAARGLGVEVVRLRVEPADDPSFTPVAIDVVLPPALEGGR